MAGWCCSSGFPSRLPEPDCRGPILMERQRLGQLTAPARTGGWASGDVTSACRLTATNRMHLIDPETKNRGATPLPSHLAGHACRGAGRNGRLYRLGLNGRIRSDEMTRLIYALKEIRACLEAETPDRRPAAAGLAVARHGQPQWPTRPLSAGSPKRLTKSKSGSSRTVRCKVVKVRRRREEDRDAAKDRHFAAHPEDRGADVVIFRNLR